jgi:hypothetical protein
MKKLSKLEKRALSLYKYFEKRGMHNIPDRVWDLFFKECDRQKKNQLYQTN